MKKVSHFLKNFCKDESGQGTAEYVLLLVVVVALVMAFKGPIMEALNGKLSDLKSSISGFNGN